MAHDPNSVPIRLKAWWSRLNWLQKSAWVVFAVIVASAAFERVTHSGAKTSATLSAKTLATRIGCSTFTQTTPAMFEAEAGDCTLDHGGLRIATFSGSQTESQWLGLARSFGGVLLVVGPDWVAINPTSIEIARRVEAKVGGRVVVPPHGSPQHA